MIETYLTPVVFWGTVATGLVVISTLSLGAIVAMLVEILPDDVRRFKAWVRRVYGRFRAQAGVALAFCRERVRQSKWRKLWAA